MKTRYMMLVSVLLVAAVLLTACPAQTATPAPTQPPAPQATEPPAPQATEPPAPTEEVVMGLKGEVTLWHSYHAGEAEEQTIAQVVEQLMKDNPELTVNMLEVPFDQIFNKWETEVAAGGGPDMYTVPNDNLGNQARAGLIAPLDDLLAGKMDVFPASSFDGATVDGQIYGVPGIIKAVGLFYNTSTVAEPPKTTDELLALVEAGKKIAIMQYGYHNFGWLTGAFGGVLMDADGACVADQGGFADALAYMQELKATGANFETDESKANTLFMQGQVDMMISGPWMLGTFGGALGDKLGVAPMPAGPGGPATPLAGVDYWHVNPNVSDEQKALAVEVALYIFGPKGAQVYADVAKAPMVAKGVTAKDPLIGVFSEIGAAGFPRPQTVEFGNWWGPFGDAVTKVMEGVSEPAAAVAEACDAMNKASGK